jgi:hypothetical protein
LFSASSFASGVGIERVVSKTTLVQAIYDPVWIRMLMLWFSGTSESRERAIGTEKHQLRQTAP